MLVGKVCLYQVSRQVFLIATAKFGQRQILYLDVPMATPLDIT